jgi:hypothetical protein
MRKEDGMAEKRPKPETEKTTINLPRALKLQAKLYAVRTRQDLQDVIAEGLRLVLARKGGR